MRFLPIIQRELLSGARNRATYWTRCAVGLVGVLICMQSMSAAPPGTPATLGRYVFDAVVAAAFLVSCGVCLLSADAISAERREGTLELIFLTGVRPVDVLLGKLGSVGLTSVCALVAFLPALVVPLLAGGVTGGEAFRKGLVLLDLLFFALVAGLCTSAAQRERFHASRGAVMIVGLVVIIPFLVFTVATHTLPRYLSLLSPLTAAIQAGDSYYGGESQPFWISLILIQALSWLLLLGAGWRLRTAVSREGSGRAAADPQKAQSEKARAVGLTSWQPSKDESNPVEWLVYRQYGIGAGLWGTALLALAYNGWVMLARQPTGPRPGLVGWLLALPFAVTAGLIGGALVAFVASRFFVGVRRSGDLELLLTTPVGADTVVADQWSVLKRLFVWPVLVMQAPMLPQILSALSALPGAPSALSDSGPILKLLTLLNLFLGTAALCWLGLWFGLKTRSQAGAIVWSVALAKGLPLLITLLGVFAGQMAINSYGGPRGFFPVFEYGPELLNAMIYLALIIIARHQLLAALAGSEPLPFTLSGSRTLAIDALEKAWSGVRRMSGWQAVRNP